jgi:hypothetical protein
MARPKEKLSKKDYRAIGPARENMLPPRENAAQFQILTRGAGIQLNERVSLRRHA